MKWPKLYIITLNWNGKSDTIECLQSLYKIEYPNYEIVVVDNWSTDDSVEVFKNKFVGLSVIENKKNLGYGAGVNKGLEFAYFKGADYFLILNNDTIIDRMAPTEMVKLAESDADVGFVSGKVYFYDKLDIIQTVGKKENRICLAEGQIGMRERDVGQFDKIEDRDFVDDVFLLVRRRVIEEVGMYDPQFFAYGEIIDWCVRVRKAGYKIMYTPGAKIWHKVSMSTGGGSNPINIYYITRSRIICIKKHFSPARFCFYTAVLFFYYAPRTIVSYSKRRQFGMLLGYLKGIGCGMLWALGGRRVLRIQRERKVRDKWRKSVKVD